MKITSLPFVRNVKQKNNSSNDKKQNNASKTTENDAKIASVLTGLDAIGRSLIHNDKSGKNSKYVRNYTLKDVDFDDGIATLKGTSGKFSGIISETLKNGDKIKLEYQDGILQKAIRSGEESFKKEYFNFSPDLPEKVVIFSDGEEKTVVPNRIKHQVLTKQKAFNGIISNKNVSIEDLQAFDREYLSAKQTDEIDALLKAKQKDAEKMQAKWLITQKTLQQQMSQTVEVEEEILGEKISFSTESNFKELLDMKIRLIKLRRSASGDVSEKCDTLIREL